MTTGSGKEMQKGARLTIVIPVYNRAALVCRTLDSVARQSLRPLKVVVVDNNSTDGSPEAVERWIEENASPELSVKLVSEPMQGAWRARARGQREVDTEFISFFDSDDEMHPDYARKIVEGFDASPRSQILLWPRRLHHGDGGVTIPRFATSPPIACQTIHSTICSASFAARTPFFLSTGGWDIASAAVWDDWVLGMNIFFHHPEFSIIPTPLAEVYLQEESITGTSFSNKKGEWEKSVERVRNLGKDFPEEARKRLGFLLDYKLAILAASYRREGEKNSARRLMNSILLRQNSLVKRLALRFAYRFTSAGLRGASLILRQLLKEPEF